MPLTGGVGAAPGGMVCGPNGCFPAAGGPMGGAGCGMCGNPGCSGECCANGQCGPMGGDARAMAQGGQRSNMNIGQQPGGFG